MGRGFESHRGYWWCQEGHPTTIAPVLKRQISPKTRSEKSPIQGFSQGMETVRGGEQAQRITKYLLHVHSP